MHFKTGKKLWAKKKVINTEMPDLFKEAPHLQITGGWQNT